MRVGFYAPCNVYNKKAGPLLGIAYIAAYLENQLGLDDFVVEVDPDRLIAQKPDVIAISAFSEHYSDVITHAPRFKAALGVPIILGGPHISALPHSLHPSIDVGVIGEGEKPMLGLMQQYLKGPLEPAKLTEIQNLIYWDEQRQLARTVFEDRIENLDMLPLPRRTMMQAFWPTLNEWIHWDQGVYSSRGCPFTCRFCMYSERANLIRYHSVAHVVTDIEDVVRNYPEQSRIIFYDDLFVTKKSRLKEIADGIRSSGLHRRVSFGCMAKTSFFDEEFCAILKSMNIKVISFGFESGSDPVLHYLKDRSSSVKKHQQSIELCQRYGIQVGGYFIIGSPPERREDLARTYWFIRQNMSQMPLISVFPLIPLPGTTLWQETKARQLVTDDFDKWHNLAYLSLEEERYIHLNEHYSRDDLKSAYDEQFYPLMQWTTGVFNHLLNYQDVLERYYKEVIPSIREQFPAGMKLLEIQRGDRDITYDLEQDYGLTSIHWKDLTKVKDQTFDGVILNHVIEKIGMDADFWEWIKQLNCPVWVLFENVGNITKIMMLLKGEFQAQWDSLESYRSRYHYTLKTLLPQLEQAGFALTYTQRYRLQMFTDEAEQVNALLQYLGQNIPTHTQLREADVFAYGLRLQPSQQSARLESSRSHAVLAPKADANGQGSLENKTPLLAAVLDVRGKPEHDDLCNH